MAAYFLLFCGLVAVVQGASWVVKGAAAVAHRFGVSELAVGLTLVAFGTSLPELSVNVLASIQGNTGIAIGNVLGSNTANILLILGLSGIICPLTVTRGTVWKEIPLGLLAAVLVWILSNDKLIDGAAVCALTRIDGLVLLCFFVVFLYYSAGIAHQIEMAGGPEAGKPYSGPSIMRLTVFGLLALILGSYWTVKGATKLAVSFGVSESVIGLTIVAVGTSLPELATSAVAAYKKRPEIAVGNVVGSNVFNIFFILGVSSLIRPLRFEATLNIDIAVVIFSSLLLFLFMFTGQKQRLDRWEAGLFIGLYTAYVLFTLVV